MERVIVTGFTDLHLRHRDDAASRDGDELDKEE